MTTRTRKSGKTAGRIDKYYYSPVGKRYRSIKQVLEAPPPSERVWYRDPYTRRLVQLKSVQEIDLGPEIEEVFIKQSVTRWELLHACVFSVVSLAFCTLSVI